RFSDRAHDAFALRAPAPCEPYPLSLHDALPILGGGAGHRTGQAVELGGEALDVRRVGHYALDRALEHVGQVAFPVVHEGLGAGEDRKSTRLNSSHVKISYAVFCLKKKK